MDFAILEGNLVTGTFWAALVSFALFVVSIATKKKDTQKAQITSILGYIAMVFVFLTSIGALISKTIASGHVPLSNLYESMVLMTSLSALIFLVIYWIYKHDSLGAIMSPGIVILIGIASILPENYKGNEPLVPALQSYWLKIHVTSMIISYSVFLLATTSALAYLFLYTWKKLGDEYPENKKEDSKLSNLSLATTGPSLTESQLSENQMPITSSAEETTEQPSEPLPRLNRDKLHGKNPQLVFFDDITYRLILLGFPILAFGIITGAMWANHAWGSYWSWDPKETSSLMTWLFYAAYLHTRVGMNMRGRNSAYLAIVAFLAVIFTYYGVNYLPGLHSYGFNVK